MKFSDKKKVFLKLYKVVANELHGTIEDTVGAIDAPCAASSYI